MESMRYTINELNKMAIAKTIICAFCHKQITVIPTESGIMISNVGGLELFVSTLCPIHGHQTNYYILAAGRWLDHIPDGNGP